MNCEACGFENRDDAHYCGDCGTPIERHCPKCDRGNPPQRKFCDGCGAALVEGAPRARVAAYADPRSYTPRHLAEEILRTRSALEGERKQVTVLFADVKGSMELAEQVDAEEWHGILDRFFQILADGVHRFAGTVNQYTGDGIMALFGAPLAHEDHAQRACYAALHLRQQLRRYADELRVSAGLNFSVRMGLNSGEVIVGRIGDDLRMDYTAQGHTVGLAARMEQLAEPGNILLTKHTADLAAGYFRLRDLGAARVKGVGEPLRLFELEDVGEVRTRFDLSRQRGFSRFVGRGAESEALEAALKRALDGEASVIGIAAQAGTGKSRLCYEFAQRCRARGIAVYEGHAVSHGKMVPLLPLLELLRGLFGIDPHDGPAAARQKIAGSIVLLDADLQASLPLWFDFLGVPDPARPLPALEPEARQAHLIEATKKLIEVRGRHEPTVLLIEDLHWLDDASEVLLGGLVEALHGSRTLLLVNYRPEYPSAWVRRAGDEIALSPLPDDAIDELLDDLLDADVQLAPLRQAVRQRTGGSPFFVEEVVRSLFDQGVLQRTSAGIVFTGETGDLEIPATVQAVLAARIDRLGDESKLVLQTAAVIGKVFTDPVLRSAMTEESPQTSPDTALAELVEADFLRVDALFPEPRYAFFHPLTQEVAYRSQLAERRVRVHAAVARAIETAHAAQLDEHAALLAHHWAAARQPLRAAEWHARAGEWLGLRDRRETMRHWRQVLELLAPLPPSAEVAGLSVLARQRLMVNGVFAGIGIDEVESLFREGLPLAESVPSLVPVLLLRMSYGLTRMFNGAIRESLTQLREVIRLADENGDRTLRYIGRVSMLATLIHSGNLRECLERAEEGELLSGGDIHLAAEMTRFSPFGVMMANRGQALMYLGRPEEAAPYLARAEAIASEREDNELLSMTSVFRAQISDLRGDTAGVDRHARAALEVAERADSSQLRIGAHGVQVLALLAAGRFEEGIEALQRVLALARESGTGMFLEVPRLVNVAEARIALGDLAAARRDIDLAVRLAHERGARLSLGWGLVVSARVRRLSGEIDAAAAALDDAAAMIEESGARAFEPLLHLERASLAARRGDDEEHRRAIEQARALFTAMDAMGRFARWMEIPSDRR